MKHNGHFTFESMIDSVCSDKNINSGTILSSDVVCIGSPFIIMLLKKYKEKLGILISIRDNRKQGRLLTPADILVDI